MLKNINIKTLIILFLFFISTSVYSQVLFLKGGVPERIKVIELGGFGYTITGKLGYDELIDCISYNTLKEKIVVRWKEYPSTSIFNLVETGEVDIIFPMTFSAGRDISANRSIPIVYSKDILVYNQNIANYRDINLPAGVRAGTTQLQYLSTMNYKNLLMTEDYPRLINILNEGKVSIIAMSYSAFKSVENEIKIPISIYFYNESEIGYYFNKKWNNILSDKFNRIIKSCQR